MIMCLGHDRETDFWTIRLPDGQVIDVLVEFDRLEISMCPPGFDAYCALHAEEIIRACNARN